MARNKTDLRDPVKAPPSPLQPAAILAALASAGNPLRPAELALLLELGPDERDALEVMVHELERNGQVVRNRAGLLLMATRANLLPGQVQGHRDGFGFLIRDDHGPDVVLSEAEMSKLVHGDRALVRVTGVDRRGRP
jgi:ribonuclease R